MLAVIVLIGSVLTSWRGLMPPCEMGEGTGMQNVPTKEHATVTLRSASVFPGMKAKLADANHAQKIVLGMGLVNT